MLVSPFLTNILVGTVPRTCKKVCTIRGDYCKAMMHIKIEMNKLSWVATLGDTN